jgi:hypothetical protein
LPKSESSWKDIFINFIIELPLLLRENRAFDAILTVVDRYSKIAYFISITIDVDAPVLAELIYNEIVKYHDIFKSIISDMGSIFTFK